MLVIEVDPTTSERRVVFHRDWHNGRLSTAYSPPPKNYTGSNDMHRLQKALLKRRAQIKQQESNDE